MSCLIADAIEASWFLVIGNPNGGFVEHGG
jgi:hypothetical protein